MPLISDIQLILIVLFGIAVLLFLVIKLKLHAFVTLLLVSMGVGILAGMPLSDVIGSLSTGMGETLGFVAIVVGLGAIFGKMLEISGGAEVLARTMIERLGLRRAQWAMAFTGFLVAIPVFFDVGFIILVPVVYGLSKKTGRSTLFYGLPLLAGLAVTHSFVPPTPGPIAIAYLLDAPLGWVILWGTIIGLPTVLIAGPLWAQHIGTKIQVMPPEYIVSDSTRSETSAGSLPGFGLVVSLILIPLLLIVANTVSGVALPEDSSIRNFFNFVGHPFVALSIAVLLTFYTLGSRRGISRQNIQEIATRSLSPAGLIILVTGAGGVFKQVLIDSGVGDVLAQMVQQSPFTPIVVAFLIAASVRIAVGSATVAMITTAGIIAPIVAPLDLSDSYRGLLVITIAAGATVLSHFNDSGFWLVNRYLGLTEKQTLKSWTVMETLIGLCGFALAFLFSFFV